MEFVPYIAIGLFGLVAGSFVNAWVWRTYRRATGNTQQATGSEEPEMDITESTTEGERDSENNSTPNPELQIPSSVFKGRSACPDCGHTLHAKDLVPVMSWIWLRGKCRYCETSISIQYPVVEITTAVAFLLVLLWWPLILGASLGWMQLILWLFITTVVVAMSVYDIRWYKLPDTMLGTLLVLTLLWHGIAAVNGAPLQEWLIAPLAGAGGAFAFFYGLYVLGHGQWMGGGDVKLVFVLGLLIGGVSTIVALFIAFLSAAALGVALMVFHRKGKRDMLPFGPFLLAGFWLAFFFGNTIADWYATLVAG